MTTKDILILLGLTEIAYQCIDNKTMLYDEFKSFFVGCDTNKMELQLKLDENIALEELKIMLKEYVNILREEQNSNE